MSYQEDVLRTEAPTTEAQLIRFESVRQELIDQLSIHGLVCSRLDKLKKFIFYNKPIAGCDYTPVLRFGDLRRVHANLGIITESAELFTSEGDEYKKELGDVTWYVALGASSCGASFDSVLDDNIAKLRLRYPERFNEQRAKSHDGN